MSRARVKALDPLDVMRDLLVRVGASAERTVFVSSQELGSWPNAATESLKSQRLLRRARSANSVVCSGCDRECVRPVHSVPTTSGRRASFVVCDKRDDINRVAVTDDELNQWRIDADALCAFVAAIHGRARVDAGGDRDVWRIAMVAGDKRQQMLCLRASTSLELVAGDASIPFADALVYEDGRYSLDGAAVRRLVDSAKTADPRYTPSTLKREARKLATQEMHRTWQRKYRALSRSQPEKGDKWYASEIAKGDESGLSVETIRKNMKR
jgi:hypothetical protein